MNQHYTKLKLASITKFVDSITFLIDFAPNTKMIVSITQSCKKLTKL